VIIYNNLKSAALGGFMGAKSRLNKKHMVVKQNAINEMRTHNMTLQELRLFTIYLSKINPKDRETKRVIFPLADFQAIMELKQLNVPYFKKVAYSLTNKPMEITTERGGFSVFNIFREFTVDADENGEWYVEIDADEKAIPLLFDFQGRFFKYELWNALRLKSKNQLRMYEILKQNEKMGYKITSINNLRDLLGMEKNEYIKFHDFKRYVLDVCRKTLAENTDISFAYEPYGKKGRGGKVLELKFTITKNVEFQDPIQLEEFIEINKEAFDESIFDSNNINLTDIDENGCVKSTGRSWIYEERITYLMTACNGEFNRDEIVVLYNEMREAVPHLYEGQENAHDYLQKKYNEMKMRKPDRSRFGYLRKIIAEDRN